MSDKKKEWLCIIYFEGLNNNNITPHFTKLDADRHGKKMAPDGHTYNIRTKEQWTKEPPVGHISLYNGALWEAMTENPDGKLIPYYG